MATSPSTNFKNALAIQNSSGTNVPFVDDAGTLQGSTLANQSVTGAKLSTAKGYYTVVVSTSSTSVVNVFAATSPFAGTITGAYTGSKDGNAANITLADTSGTVTVIPKGTTNGGMVSATSIANASFAAGDTVTVTSSATNGAAAVYVVFTVA